MLRYVVAIVLIIMSIVADFFGGSTKPTLGGKLYARQHSILLMPTQLVPAEFLRELGIGKVFLCSHPYYYDRLKFHKLKLAYLYATARKYKEELGDEFDVEYVEDVCSADYVVDPIDDEPRKLISNMGKLVDSPNFFLSHDEAVAASHPHDKFYKEQKQKFGVLVGEPSFDTENRKKFADVSAVLEADAQTANLANLDREAKATACKWANENYPDNYGTADPENFVFPISRAAAEATLTLAMKHLSHFGEFQDAVSPSVAFGYHSVLSSALNVGLLSPIKAVNMAMVELEAGRAPLASVEAFVRQILGWREYVRSVYVREADAHRQANYFGGEADIPRGWYTADTGINLVDAILRRVDRYAYAHHIERLMYLCAVLNMMGCRPTAIHDWFMEMVAIDAYDWVMVPNITMGTYRVGNGGSVNIVDGDKLSSVPSAMTKHPYFSSYAYVKKMSGEKDEADKAIWDGLYYAFLEKHADLHKKNYFTAKQLRLVSHADK